MSNMAISCLGGITQMEIRPASSDRKDVLFEMVTSEFTNVCCRVDTSYDLVVRDVDSGAILFCINGAEIEDHLVEVYVEEPIGRIKNGKIFLVSSSSNVFKIEGTKGQYSINRSLVRVTPGQVKLDWPQNASNEMKGMTMAFALNMSMTKYKSTVIEDCTIRRIFHCDIYDHFNALPSTLEVSPRDNMPTTPSIFAPSNMEQFFWLTTVRGDPKTFEKITFVTDKNRNVLLLVRNRFVNKFSLRKTIVEKINGIEEFTVETSGHKEKNSLLHIVYCCQKEIGRIEYNNEKRVHTLIDRTAKGNEAVLTSSVLTRGKTLINFTDRNGLVHGGMNKQFYTALKIQLSAGTSPVMKRLIVCTAIQFFGSYLQNFAKCPDVAIKSLKCNCSQCLQLLHKSEPYHLKSVHQIFNESKVKLRTAGHSKKNNVTYFEVSRHLGGMVLCTLEVTPIKDFTGVAKVVCKTGNGSIMFTSLNSPVNCLTVIYNSGNALVGYIKNSKAYSSDIKLMLKFRETKKTQEYDETFFGPNINFNLSRESGQWVSSISSSFCCLDLYRPSKEMVKLTQFELSVELTLAALFHSDPYEFDKIPTPEIAYFYKTKN